MLNRMEVRLVITTLLVCLWQVNSTTDPPPIDVDTTESTSSPVITYLETTTIYEDSDTTKGSEKTTVSNDLDTTGTDGSGTSTVLYDNIATSISDGLEMTTISDSSDSTTISDSTVTTTVSDKSGETTTFDGSDTTSVSDGLVAITVSTDSETTKGIEDSNKNTVLSVTTTLDTASDATVTVSGVSNTSTVSDVSGTTTSPDITNTTTASDVSNASAFSGNDTISEYETTTGTENTGNEVRCGEDWLEGPLKCYKFEMDLKAWENAKYRCELTRGAKLISIEDESTMNWIKQNLERIQNSSTKIYSWWMNLEKREEINETKWFWQTGTELDSSFVIWRAGEPNNFQNNEHCVIMCCQHSLNDVNCDRTSSYICEMDKDSIHGGWSEWTSYGTCSSNCETGIMHRTRKCNNPSPILGGDDCPGDSLESVTCDTEVECCAPQVYDLVFMIDVTYRYYLSQVKTLFKDIVTKFNIGFSKTRVATALFSSTQTLLFDFVTYTNATQVQNALDAGIKYESGTTNPREALDFVRRTMFGWWYGGRSDVTDVLVFFITKDDYSYDNINGTIINDDPKVNAQKLKDAGVYMVALEGYDQTELSTYSDVYHSFYQLNSSDRPTIISKIETGFPCHYFCSVSAFSFDVPETLGTGNDSTNGTIFLMTDSSFQITCCGATSTWEFYAVNYGIIEVMIFRLDGYMQYYLAGSTRIVIPEEYIGKVVSFNLIDGERVAVVKGDLIGWYTSGPNIVGYGDCTKDSRSDCPQNNKLLTISRDSFEVGDTLDFSAATTVSDRGFSMKLTTINNTELVIEKIEEYTEIEENSPIGFDAMYISVTDTDLNDDFNMTLSGDDELFEITDVVSQRATIKLRQKLPKVGGPYVMTVTGTDSCQHTASTTVTVGKYNAPPIVNNLPYITEISELTKSAIHLYTINVTDASNDVICCTLSKTLPNTYNFEFKEENGVYSIWTVANPAFSYYDADSFRVFICCNDPYGATTSYLMVRLTENRIEEKYEPPEWFHTAIVVCMLPISILTMFTFFILVITMFCMDPEPDKPWEHQEIEFEHSIHSGDTFSEDNTDSTSIKLSLSDQLEVKTETSLKNQEETIHFKNAVTEKEFFIPIWRRKGQSDDNEKPVKDDNVLTKSPNTKGTKKKAYPKTLIKEKTCFSEPGKLEMKLFSFGGDPSISMRTKEEREYEVNMKKNNIMLKYKEALLKAGTMKKRKSTATFHNKKKTFNSETKIEPIEMVTRAQVHQEKETKQETATEITPHTQKATMTEIPPEIERETETEITPDIEEQTKTEIIPEAEQEMETETTPEVVKKSETTQEVVDEILDNNHETFETLA